MNLLKIIVAESGCIRVVTTPLVVRFFNTYTRRYELYLISDFYQKALQDP